MTAIQYFKIVGKVIERNLQVIMNNKGLDRETAIQKILSYCKEISIQYFSGHVPDIHYEDPLCRIAYLYKNVPANSAAMEYVCENSPNFEEFIKRKQIQTGRVNICALGGGPGTELLSLSKRIENASFPKISLKFLLFDKFSEWIDSWSAIEAEMETRLSEVYGKEELWPLRWNGNYFRIDISNTSGFGCLGNCFGQDIHIFSYFVSEVYKIEGFKVFFKEIVENAPKDARFLFVERLEEEKDWKSEIEDLARKNGLLVTNSIEKKDGVISSDEQKTDLGPIYYELAECGMAPRLTWDIFSVEATKTRLADFI